MSASLVGSEMCIRDSHCTWRGPPRGCAAGPDAHSIATGIMRAGPGAPDPPERPARTCDATVPAARTDT
eukprot:14516586-Alexandrium_andersonii.AAC.1